MPGLVPGPPRAKRLVTTGKAAGKPGPPPKRQVKPGIEIVLAAPTAIQVHLVHIGQSQCQMSSFNIGLTPW